MTSLSHESETSSLAKAAEQYAGHGLVVFPCYPRRKDPMTEHGRLDAVADVSQIGAWWSKTPEANIGLPCKVNGLLVLDVDRHINKVTGEMVDGLATLAELSGGAEIITPTADTGGGGVHYLFHAPGWAPSGRAGPGLDVQYNGYIVAPPSIHPNGPLYLWRDGLAPWEVELAEVPDWLSARIRPQERPACPKQPEGASWLIDPEGRLSPEEVALAALMYIPADEYDVWVKVGLALHALGLPVTDWDCWSQSSPGKYKPGECAKKWLTFAGSDRPEVAPGWLVNKAREAEPGFIKDGWRSTARSASATTHPGATPSGRANLEPAAEVVADPVGGRHCRPGDHRCDDVGDAELCGGRPGENAAETQNHSQRRSQAAQLLDIVRDASVLLFRAEGTGEAFASYPVGDHWEAHPLSERGGGLRHWLDRGYRARHGSPPSASAMQQAMTSCIADALSSENGEEHPVHLRIAEHEGRIYLDLGRPDHRVVEVDTSGWRVRPCPAGLFFRRPTSVYPLPDPDRHGTLDSLRRVLDPWIHNDEDGFILLCSWLLGTLQPGFPFASLALYGEQGGGKSTLTKLLRSLVDPCGSHGRSVARPPKASEDLAALSTVRHIMAFENLSSLPDWLSDDMAAISTGVDFAGRKLFTDNDVAEVSALRPMIINGITEVATRPDLLDRFMVFTVPLIRKRISEKDLWPAVRAATPSILGGLLTAVSAALRGRDRVTGDLPRMADFARFIVAAEPALPWAPGRFLEVYGEARNRSVETALDASPIATLLVDLVNGADHGEWTGSATELLEVLAVIAEPETRRQPRWPKDAARLAGEVRRLMPALRQAGLMDYNEGRSHGGRKWIKLTKLGDSPGPMSVTTRAASVTREAVASPLDPSTARSTSGSGDGGDHGVGGNPSLSLGRQEVGSDDLFHWHTDRESGDTAVTAISSVTADPDEEGEAW